MVRVKRGISINKRKKKYLLKAKGYSGLNSSSSILAMEQIIQSFNYQYIGRKLNKRNLKSIWISKINTMLKKKNISYSIFFNKLKSNLIYLNTYVLNFMKIKIFNFLCRLFSYKLKC